MATTNEVISDIINGPDRALFKKARGALVTIARDIIAEADPKGAYWFTRRKWAERVMANPDIAMPRVRVELSQVAGIRNKYDTDDHTDNEVKNVITANLDRVISETL